MESQAQLWRAKSLFDGVMAAGLAAAPFFHEWTWSWYLVPGSIDRLMK
jgi:hypothetical protein